ncbi:minor capsid protein [Cytobacillus praedii]|uniref:minor capsid protein n=1 Tax=Cytobacillus praedii TaxID=1742358 RepID=UPI002E20782C|nr:minor capsid protein [Cytobacillus praedii]MED3571952.1 minor capsid protein [Cytobacillus praedii]
MQHQGMLDRRAAAYAQELLELWDRITESITKEIKAIYNEVQDAQGVPITKQPIDAAKFRNMQRQLERLDMLLQQLVELMKPEEQTKALSRNLAFTYAESYYFSAFSLEQASKVAVAVPVLTDTHVIGVLINPWLPDGNTYSDRLRANTAYLAEKMVKTLEEGMGAGWSVNRTAREIQNAAQEGYFNAVRLARTEMNRAAGQAANHSYMQNADILDSKRWNATLDARTAPKDAQNDGEVFPLAYDTPEMPGKPGKRIPNHPNCRCKWSPVLSALGISARERIARGTGDTKTNFGERIYTKARTYKEYAKERGLPDVDEAVRNDNPRSYLRRGENIKDIPKDFFG